MLHHVILFFDRGTRMVMSNKCSSIFVRLLVGRLRIFFVLC